MPREISRYKLEKFRRILERRRTYLEVKAHGPDEPDSSRHWDLAEAAALRYCLELLDDQAKRKEHEGVFRP